MYVRRNLGAYQQDLAVTQAAAGTAASVATAAGATGALATIGPLALTVPVVGGIIAGVAGLAALLGVGKGCGAACTNAATAEQAYEWAGNMVKKVLNAGMLSGAQAYQAGQWLIQQARSNMSGGDRHMTDGLNNAIKTISNELPASLIASVPSQKVGLDPTKLQSMFPASRTGWYDLSVQDGNSLALQAIGNLPGVQRAVDASQTGAATNPAAAGGFNLKDLLLLGGGAAALYALL